MKNHLNIDNKMYRHANFLKTLSLNEYEVKIIPLFLKSNQYFTSKDNKNIKLEEHSLSNQKVAVEY
jgi:hypothetical protein